MGTYVINELTDSLHVVVKFLAAYHVPFADELICHFVDNEDVGLTEQR
jgi:hypothetical protein